MGSPVPPVPPPAPVSNARAPIIQVDSSRASAATSSRVMMIQHCKQAVAHP